MLKSYKFCMCQSACLRKDGSNLAGIQVPLLFICSSPHTYHFYILIQYFQPRYQPTKMSSIPFVSKNCSGKIHNQPAQPSTSLFIMKGTPLMAKKLEQLSRIKAAPLTGTHNPRGIPGLPVLIPASRDPGTYIMVLLLHSTSRNYWPVLTWPTLLRKLSKAISFMLVISAKVE